MKDDLAAYKLEVANDLCPAGEDDLQQIESAFTEDWLDAGLSSGHCAELTRCGVRHDGAPPFRLDAFSLSDDGELRLAIAAFDDLPGVSKLNKAQIDHIVSRVENFLSIAFDRARLSSLEPGGENYAVARQLFDNMACVDRIRVCVLTNAEVVVRGNYVHARFQSWDMAVNWVDLRTREEINEARGNAGPIELSSSELGEGLKAVEAGGTSDEFSTYLAVVPATVLADVYYGYGARLLEQNVRAFLQTRGGINKGMLETIEHVPERFLAFNNGVTATASDITLERSQSGDLLITSISGLQIVNGGQTTACIEHARRVKKSSLENVVVQMKLSVVAEKLLAEVVPKISEYANTQNTVQKSDLFANHPFHVQFEHMAASTAAPPAPGSNQAIKWFYVRARGQFETQRGRLETRAEQTKYNNMYPNSRRLQKTDLAKYLLTFDCKPVAVSKGAQKAMLEFANRVDRDWKKDAGLVNEQFYRESIAKAIIFRWADKAIQRSAWYELQRGFKSFTVTYALAFLVHRLRNQRGAVLNLDLVWDRQEVPLDLQTLILESAADMHRLLRDLAGGRNVGEIAKRDQTWDQVRQSRARIDSEIDGFTLPLDAQANGANASLLALCSQEVRRAA